MLFIIHDLFGSFLCRKFMKLSENICDALRNLLPFVQFKTEKQRSVTFSKVAG